MSTTDIPETDLVVIAERDVISKARDWYAIWRENPTSHRERDARIKRLHDAQCETLAAISLLESREADRERLEGK